jgi:hypothetical protein
MSSVVVICHHRLASVCFALWLLPLILSLCLCISPPAALGGLNIELFLCLLRLQLIVSASFIGISWTVDEKSPPLPGSFRVYFVLTTVGSKEGTKGGTKEDQRNVV